MKTRITIPPYELTQEELDSIFDARSELITSGLNRKYHEMKNGKQVNVLMETLYLYQARLRG